MEEQLRRDALEYHRVPTFGKNLRHADQEPDESARPGARLFAGCCLCVPCGDVSHLIADEFDGAVRQNAHKERQMLTNSAHVSHKTI